ncbi:hypothetical protein IAI51_22115 [Pseudomonas sp. N40(2020)]|uniref:DUF6124 family protein n=1 Tax=Pseudomonas sp. N40(2020) TaxID=2767798 RepID=UPI001656FC20|nr:DUF6124 family protein [Pseudomonas sp. N40(2020)]MBC8999226.1 hypothetical protein [Pseudomonas sp. N40(2020)]
MSKTPEPPVTDPDCLLPAAVIMATPYTPSTLFTVNPQSDTESLLTNASGSLASAAVMLGNFAGVLEGSNRNALLGIAQVVMLGELAVNKALDNVVPTD